MLEASGARSSDCKQLYMYAGFLSLVLSTSIVISGQGPEGAEPAPVARVPRTWLGKAPLGIILFLSIGFLSWTAAHIVYNVATEMVAMSSSVEKLVDHITSEKAGFSCLRACCPAGVFVSFALIA